MHLLDDILQLAVLPCSALGGAGAVPYVGPVETFYGDADGNFCVNDPTEAHPEAEGCDPKEAPSATKVLWLLRL